MSDENGTAPTTTEIASLDNPLVSKPFVSPKPYDNDVMEAYSKEEASTEAEESTQEGEETVTEDNETETPVPAKATKHDQVDDGFEKIVIKKEINGKPLEFTVADAIKAKMNQEETTRNLDRRATYLKQRETAWQNDQDRFKEKVQNVINAARSGDFHTSISALAKLAKGNSDFDVVAFEKEYFDQLEKSGEVYRKMTPEQREAFFAQRKLAQVTAENARYAEKEKFERAKTELQLKVESLQKDHNIPAEEFWGNYKALIENHTGEGKKFSSKEDVTAEEVIAYSNEIRHWTRVFEAGEEAGVQDEAILEEVKKIAELNPDYTTADLVKIMNNAGFATKLADPQMVENLNRKAGKSRLTQQGTATKKQTNGKVEGYDKETMDYLYRNQPKVYQRPAR